MAKKKLTLSVEEDVIEAARRYSKQAGVSISELVTRYLQALTHPGDAMSPVTRRLRGILHADADREAYRRHLLQKHGT